MKRQHQRPRIAVLLIASTLALSWLAMQAVHELGHVAAAWQTGAHVAAVNLRPTSISYTLLTANPKPLVVAWAGPICGITLPLLAWLIARPLRLRGWYVLQFFAGFCLVANGAYLVGGTWYEMGDAGELIRHGTGRWLISLIGVPLAVAGLWLWNGLGPRFGLGKSPTAVDRAVTIVVISLLLATVALELLFAG